MAESIIPQATAAYAVSIPTGQWSGSGSDRYITVNANNVTADSILIPQYDHASEALLKGPVWCVPAAGSFTIHTTDVPTGTVSLVVLMSGIVGEAQYQVLADVYSKAQTDALVAQSTAVKRITVTGTPNQYGSLAYTAELEAVTDRITGIVSVTNGGRVNVTTFWQSGVHYFACYDIYNRAPYTSELSITVSYI